MLSTLSEPGDKLKSRANYIYSASVGVPWIPLVKHVSIHAEKLYRWNLSPGTPIGVDLPLLKLGR